MKKSILLIACVGAFVVVFRLLSVQSPMERPDFLREVLAPNDGFASEGSGTTGGAAALQDNIFRVTNTEYHTRGLHTRCSIPPQLRQEEAQEDVGEDAANARG